LGRYGTGGKKLQSYFFLQDEPDLLLPPFMGLNGLGCGFGMEDFAMVNYSFPWLKVSGFSGSLDCG